MQYPFRVWIVPLLLALLSAWLLAFVLFPSSSAILERDLVALAVIGIPALLIAIHYHRQKQPRYAARAGALFFCSVLTLGLGPIAASGELEAALAYCNGMVKRLEKRRAKKGFYPHKFVFPDKPRPRHLSLHANACRYKRKDHKAFTFAVNRIDRDERLVYRSWDRGWFTESGEPWPLPN